MWGSCLGTAETPLPIPTRRQSRHPAGQTKGMSGRLPTLPVEVASSAFCWLGSRTKPPQGGGSGEQLWQEAGPSFTGRLHGAGEKKPTHSSGFPFPPAVMQLAGGNLLFRGRLSRNLLFQPMQPEARGDLGHLLGFQVRKPALQCGGGGVGWGASLAGGRPGLQTRGKP